MCGGGGGDGTQVSEVTQTTSNVPEWARPYYEDLLTRTGFETAQPYEAYQGQRLAYFSPMEQEALSRYGQLGVSGTPPELDAAGASAYDLTQGWNPYFDSGIYTGGIDSGYRGGNVGSGYNAGSLGMNYNPETRDSQFTARDYDYENAYTAGQRDMGFYAGDIGAEGALDRYMDPYYQQVVDVEKREAARQSDMRHAATGLNAASAGSLGGYREGIMRSEEERNLGYLMGDIQKRGSQDAYRTALQSFEADRSARGQEEQFGQSQFALNEQMRQRQAELQQQGYSLSEASRMAQEEFAQSQYGLNQQALQAKEGFTQNQYALQQQAQQMQSQLKIAAFQASQDAQAEAGRQGLTAAQIQQAGEVAAANVMLQQDVTRLGIDQTRLGATGMLGDFAAQRQGMELERLNAMRQAGLAERGLMQQGLDMGYQDFLNQRDWGWDQIGRSSTILQGLPIGPNQTTSSYGPQPSFGQQALGGGLAGLGLYNQFGGGG